MSAFRSNIVLVTGTERFGFGATLAADGSITSIDGASLRYVTALPVQADNAGSLAMRDNGSLYIRSGGAWIASGGAAGFSVPDDVAITWGTNAPGQVTGTFISASTRWDLLGDSINQAVAASGSAIRIRTGTNTITGAVVGNASAAMDIRTGDTDTTNAAGTGGPSGTMTISTGNCTSTLGVSGSSAILLLTTGNSDDANSGNLQLSTGTAAAGTRGTLDVDIATIDLSTQATDLTIIDNVGASLRILQGANVYIGIDTTNNAEVITLGRAPSAAGPNAAVDVATVGAITTNGTDFGTRLSIVEEFTQRSGIAADVGIGFNVSFVTLGTNSTSALCTFATGGGITLTTGALINDQMCVRGHTTAGQSIWTGTNWSTNDGVRWKCNVRSPATITTMVAAAGLKLSLAAGATLFDNATDADQVYFGFSTDARYGGVAANWTAVIRIGGASTNADTTVVFAASTNFRLVLDIDSARVARFYINGVLRVTSGALTAAVNLLPFAGVEALAAAAARAITVQRMGISKLLT